MTMIFLSQMNSDELIGFEMATILKRNFKAFVLRDLIELLFTFAFFAYSFSFHYSVTVAISITILVLVFNLLISSYFYYKSEIISLYKVQCYVFKCLFLWYLLPFWVFAGAVLSKIQLWNIYTGLVLVIFSSLIFYLNYRFLINPLEKDLEILCSK